MNVCILILIMWFIMGGRRVCFIVGLCTVDIMDQRNGKILYLGRHGLYIFDADVIEEAT